MNYITQLNGFFGYLDKELSLTPNSVSLYLALLHINNTKDWVKEFAVKNSYIEKLIGIHRVKLDEARNKLKQAGLIRYVKSTGNLIGTYSIYEFDKNGEILNNFIAKDLKKYEESANLGTQSVTQLGTQAVTQIVTQTGTESVTQTGTQNDSLPIILNKPKRKHDIICADAETKKNFGEFQNVKMKQEEYDKLISRFGQNMVSRKIDSLDSNIQSKIKKYMDYKDHYATILNWCKGDSENGSGSGNKSAPPPAGRKSFSELADEIKNEEGYI